jgi:glycosyltransferase involved in cell wall biosynthesis
MPLLSAYLIVKNEARDLPACLASLKGLAEEIVVVDDESTDDTLRLVETFGAKTFKRKMQGFGSQKQFALEQCTGEWVLSIDADERVSPELATAIREAISKKDGPAGYFLKRHMFFLGKRLRFGGVGSDWVLRLFRRSLGRYEPREIHERVEVKGETARLSGHLDHYSYTTLDEYLQKIPAYTSMAAQQRWDEGKRFAFWHHARPGWELFSRVVLKGAWLDGQAGLTYAALSAHAAWLRSMKLKELGASQHA